MNLDDTVKTTTVTFVTQGGGTPPSWLAESDCVITSVSGLITGGSSLALQPVNDFLSSAEQVSQSWIAAFYVPGGASDFRSVSMRFPIRANDRIWLLTGGVCVISLVIEL